MTKQSTTPEQIEIKAGQRYNTYGQTITIESVDENVIRSRRKGDETDTYTRKAEIIYCIKYGYWTLIPEVEQIEDVPVKKQSITPNSSFTDTFKEGDIEIDLPGIDVVDKFMASFYRKPKNAIERALVSLVEVIRTKAAHIERNGHGMFELHAPADEDPYIKLGPLKIKANRLDIEIVRACDKVRFETILPIGEHEAIINMGDAANTAEYLTWFLRHNDLNSI